MPEHPYTTTSTIIENAMLPDPTIPVPFEKFAAHAQSDDMLQRAIFWCFYAAWLEEKQQSPTVATAVQARNDGHLLRMVTHELHIRDCVLMQKHDVEELERVYTNYQEEHEPSLRYTIVGWLIVLTLVIGVLIGMVLL